MNKIKQLLANKKILIYGYGKEGKSTHRFILKNKINCLITICDKKDIKEELIDLDTNSIDENELWDNIDAFDIIIKAPGISLKNKKTYKKIYSQTELFLMEYRNRVIGVTGTKGKSTTATLIYEIFKKAGKDAILVGNIGKPVFDSLNEINEDTVVVYEMSSHQLEYISVSPQMGIILNIYEEHLDYYSSYNNYAKAKFNIFKYQKVEDIALLTEEVLRTSKRLEVDIKSTKILLDKKDGMFHVKHDKILYEDEEVFDNNINKSLIGNHNLFNVLVCFNVANIFGIDFEIVRNAVREFKGLRHRMEYIGKVCDIVFYDDSISTIPETCMLSIDSLKNVSTVIVGGLDRGINYSDLIDYLKNKKKLNVICISTTGRKIFDGLKNTKENVYYFENLEEAVLKAFEITEKEKICLLSPAAASYNEFKSFEERGELFKKYINEKRNVSRET